MNILFPVFPKISAHTQVRASKKQPPRTTIGATASLLFESSSSRLSFSSSAFPRNPARFQIHPKFSGLTGTLRNRHWVSAKTFQALLNVSPTPYVGQLPKVIVNAASESPKQVYLALDELSPLLSSRNQPQNMEVAFDIGKSDKPLTIQYIGQGAFGTVYRLTVNNQHFALKVYHDESQSFSHGAMGEIATGLYLSKKNFKDLAKFHFGNPIEGWAVFEFIEDSSSADSRHGQSIHDLPVSLDDNHERNSINGIRVDYGAIVKEKKRVPSPVERFNFRSLDDYKRAMESNEPSLQAKAASMIYNLLEYERTEAFLMAMQTNQPTVQANAASRIYCLPEAFRQYAFELAMQTNQPNVQANAVSRIDYLPEAFRQSAFEIAMQTKQPIVQANATSMIYCLPEAFRQYAFELAMQTNQPTVQANAASMINCLPEAFRKNAFEIAMQTNQPNAQAYAASKMTALPIAYREKAYRLAMQTNNTKVQENAAYRIYCLPEAFRQNAFEIAMQTNNPLAQIKALEQLSYLYFSDKMDVFKLAMQTGNLLVQAKAASYITSLPQAFKDEAFKLYAQALEQNHAFRHVKNLKVTFSQNQPPQERGGGGNTDLPP